jgi:AraC-like DNA-binding protein
LTWQANLTPEQGRPGATVKAAEIMHVDAIPTATGGIARAAYAAAVQAGCDVEALLKSSGLVSGQIRNPAVRISVRAQIRFLNVVSRALQDEFLGIRLAQNLELRELGLLYYVPASSASLGEALHRLARYSTIHNEGLYLKFSERGSMVVTFEYCGISRMADCHQMEFFIMTLLRLCQQLTGSRILPTGIKLVHHRTKMPPELRALFGGKVAFGCDADEVAYSKSAKYAPTVGADPFLNSLLVKYCDQALSSRRRRSSGWRVVVENAVAPQLPHGQVRMSEVSQRLGISQRTLARRLASEGLTFGEVLDRLRFDLAKQYLREPDLPTSEIGWLLGYRESSAFNHAFKRWTGQTPSQVRLHG